MAVQNSDTEWITYLMSVHDWWLLEDFAHAVDHGNIKVLDCALKCMLSYVAPLVDPDYHDVSAWYGPVKCIGTRPILTEWIYRTITEDMEEMIQPTTFRWLCENYCEGIISIKNMGDIMSPFIV
jgi:hypothetical protein